MYEYTDIKNVISNCVLQNSRVYTVHPQRLLTVLVSVLLTSKLAEFENRPKPLQHVAEPVLLAKVEEIGRF
jgi:hypothetical protein